MSHPVIHAAALRVDGDAEVITGDLGRGPPLPDDAEGARQGTMMQPATRVRAQETVHDDDSYDAMVIGGGQAGPFLATRLAAVRPAKVAIVEREHLGGTCVNDGCIPTKTLVRERTCRPHRVARQPSYGVNSAGRSGST